MFLQYLSLLAAVLHFFQYLMEKSLIGCCFFYLLVCFRGKLLTLSLMRIWALLEVLLTIVWAVIFHFCDASVCWNTPCTLFNRLQKQPDFVSLHLLWWYNKQEKKMKKAQKSIATFLESPVISNWKIRFHAGFYHFCFIVHGISLLSRSCFVPLSCVHNVALWYMLKFPSKLISLFVGGKVKLIFFVK